ncbi:MAG: bifunctional folylpolyglutamate synthase/dihydrofolate synthase, partial [Alphaproteobacteria bacterium]
SLTPEIAAAAVAGARWPARLQRLTSGPLVETLAPRAVWLDGGHNPGAAEALAETLADWPARPRLLVGMLKTKDAAAYLKRLAPVVGPVETVAVPGADSTMTAEALAESARAAGMAARPHGALDAAAAAIDAAGDDAPVLIAGSLYLAGHVLATHG